MEYKTISFIVPTIGRESLKETLASIETWPGDEVLVIKHDPPSGDWGSSERNEGMKKAKCDYLAFIDDDDIYVQGHRQVMDKATKENPKLFPILFRMLYKSGRILWDKPRLKCNRMGSPMIFVPNIGDKFVPWNGTVQADFQFMNAQYWPHRKIIFREEIVALVNNEDSGDESDKWKSEKMHRKQR